MIRASPVDANGAEATVLTVRVEFGRDMASPVADCVWC